MKRMVFPFVLLVISVSSFSSLSAMWGKSSGFGADVGKEFGLPFQRAVESLQKLLEGDSINNLANTIGTNFTNSVSTPVNNLIFSLNSFNTTLNTIATTLNNSNANNPVTISTNHNLTIPTVLFNLSPGAQKFIICFSGGFFIFAVGTYMVMRTPREKYDTLWEKTFGLGCMVLGGCVLVHQYNNAH